MPYYTPAQPELHFAVRMQAAGREYWDNNGGRNYRVGLAAP